MDRANVGVLPHTPALLLLFSKVAFFLSPCVHCGRNHTGADADALGTHAELREPWIIPILYIITTLVSMAFAQLLGLALRIERYQRAFATATGMFMNSNTSPIALMQLGSTVWEMKSGPQDTDDEMLGRALGYLALHSTLGLVVISAAPPQKLALVLKIAIWSWVRWSYGVRLLLEGDPEFPGETSPKPGRSPVAGPVEMTYSGSVRPLERRPGSSTVVSTASGGVCGQTSPASHRGDVDAVGASPYEGDTDAAMELTYGSSRPAGSKYQTEPTTSIWQSRIRERWANRVRELWMDFFECMTVPLWAALASLVVACISPLQRTLA